MAGTETLYPVLSSAKIRRPNESDRRLPTWLAHPTQFPAVNLQEAGADIDEFASFIDDDLRNYIKKNMLVERVFPVQKALIPSLTMQFKSRPYRRPNDICVSSPTGSGKTLAFAIPIVNYLKQSLARSLRVLVVLPTRDLATQVFKVFQQLCVPTNVQCALADTQDSSRAYFRKVNHYNMDLPVQTNGSKNGSNQGQDEYVSNIDLLVCTPGLLIDLLHLSPGFSLEDLELLVMDEADRLMASHKHDWLNTIERSVFPSTTECGCTMKNSSKQASNQKELLNKKPRVCYNSITGCSVRNAHQSKPLHKLLFSATLSSDPQLLMHMNLFQPRLFLAIKPTITGTKIRNSLGSATSTPCSSPLPFINQTVNTRSELLSSSAIPEQLEEKMFITEPKEKMFVIWYLFHELKYKKVICFTNQLQTSFKLCKFLNEIHNVRAVEFSSNLKPENRQKVLNEFKNDRIEVIVSTDLMARGMDVEGVKYIISYDVPSSEVFYVHRVGRTARAGNKGSAITLVDTKQLVQFKKVVQLAHKLPNSMRLSDVVEEQKVPYSVKKNSEVYDLYIKTVADYEDKLATLAKRNKFARKSK